MACRLNNNCILTKIIKQFTKNINYTLNAYSTKFQGNATDIQPTEKQKTYDRKTAVDTLQSVLGIKRYTAIDLVAQTKEFCQLPPDLIKENHNILKSYGIPTMTLVKYPQLLIVENEGLSNKIEEIKKLPYSLKHTILLVTANRQHLQKILNKHDLSKRIDSFASKLNTSVNVVIEGFVKKRFLLTRDLKHLEDVIDLLKARNVSTQEIIKDWWVLQYSTKLIEDRIQLSKANNIDPIKTWMVRCTLDILEKYFQRRSDNKLVLGENTFPEYLSQRLECSTDEAKGLMLKHPALQNKSMKKMKEIIDFLYSEGYKPYHIYRVPKILLHSVETTKKRIREVEKQGVKMDSLYILTKSQKQYMQYYQTLVKSNQNKCKDNEEE